MMLFYNNSYDGMLLLNDASDCSYARVLKENRFTKDF